MNKLHLIVPYITALVVLTLAGFYGLALLFINNFELGVVAITIVAMLVVALYIINLKVREYEQPN